MLEANPKVEFAVVGHTDDKGEYDYNLGLSKDRAGAVVADSITAHGIADDRLFAAGASLLSPIASNDSEQGGRAPIRIFGRGHVPGKRTSAS